MRGLNDLLQVYSQQLNKGVSLQLVSQSIEPEELFDGDPVGQSLVKILRDWALVVCIALAAALLVRFYVLQQYYISGPSMESTLFENDRVLVSKISYQLGGIGRGDVIVFDRITSDGATVAHDDLIKRVVGLPGEKVEIRSCVVFINDVALDEPYLDEEDLTQVELVDKCGQPNMSPKIVPANQIFVMGDNRPDSFDSRSFGSISERLVVGRAFVAIWPFDSWKIL